MKKFLALITALLLIVPLASVCASANDYEDSIIALVGEPDDEAGLDIELSLASGRLAEGETVTVQIDFVNYTVSDVAVVCFDLYFDAEVLELQYDPVEDIGDDMELLLDNFAVLPGRNGDWESLVKFRPDTEPGVIHFNFGTTKTRAVANNDGDIVITLPFTVLSGECEETAIYVPTNERANINTYSFVPYPANGDYVFVLAPVIYTVAFVDDDGTVISSAQYEEGDEIAVPDDPSKPADNYNTYEFIGWDPAVVTVCAGDATYTATYGATPIDYTVTFLNEDGALISSETYHYDDPIDVPEDPSKPADETYTYSFAGWDPEVAENCAGDAEYTATYNATYIEYTVAFYDEDGSPISSATYHYGDPINVPEDPSKPEDDQYTYVFTGWDPAVSETCAGNAEYTAVYASVPKSGTYAITVDHANGINEGGVSVIFGGDTVESAILAVKPADYILGDVNGDGKIEAVDYLMVKRHVLKSYILEGDMFFRGDIDGNGTIEAQDYLKIKRHVLNSYTIPQPEIVLGDDLSDYVVITVDAEGKIASINSEIGTAKADTAISEGGYALVIHKDAIGNDVALVLGYLETGDTVGLENIDFEAL
ncbi:MAG: InlB B-repeat-containing protein, partial [Clostridia bacterium]|nr:InlB B-repeat-containing protein [Clostridia bacterium]